MMKKLLKITEIANFAKCACQRYLFQICIAKYEGLNEEWVKILRHYILNFLR